MQHLHSKLTAIFFFLMIPAVFFAQSTGDYNVYLNSGKFIPAENISSLSANDDVFLKTQFGNRHYVAIQFFTLPGEVLKNQLREAGIELMDYLPKNTFTASVAKEVSVAALKTFGIRSIFQLEKNQKTISSIIAGNFPSYAIKQPGFVDIDIVTYDKMDASVVQNAIAGFNAAIIEDVQLFKRFTIRVPQSHAAKLAELSFVLWAELCAPPSIPENLPGRTLHRVNVLQDGVRNLKGDNINIGVWDENASQHLDFSPSGRMVNMNSGGVGSHGTHVSGTIGGRGIINPIAKGMAPNAKIYSYLASGNIQTTMSTAIPANTLIASNHSYFDGQSAQCGTSSPTSAYTLRSRETDLNINNNPYHLHCHSSGNQQGNCFDGYGTITGTGKSAKNIIVVGNITTSEVLSSSSSCGPVHDGRIKPEIVAMGTSVFSTYTPINTYASISGTSMATPGITGTVALLVQRFKQLNGNTLPNSALIKNVLCNTARDLGNAGPDYKFGFGRVNALSAVRVLEENRYITNNVTTGGSNEFTINVPAGATSLNVMLTWNDPAGAANADLAIVNSLDLMIFKGTDTTRPWILNKEIPSLLATRAKDTVSNIEQVTINNPTGTYTVRVEGVSVPVGPNQTYFVSWNIEQPSIEVIYPNGNESFNPASNEIITWNNSGITGNQTVEYSLDNGGIWTVISSTVPAATTRLTWAVPAANTSSALIRITSGAISDVSDDKFKILGTATGLTTIASCTANSLNFSWTAVSNASAYDLLRLNSTTGLWETVASNIVGTSHVLGGLTPLSNAWYAVQSKNTTTGAVGERSVAINRIAPISGATIGAVSGTNTVCEGSTANFTYTVPAFSGASSYTWSVPAGAVITAGQGTTSISVNYPDGSASGNVSVQANDAGGCKSNASIRAITVNPKPAKPLISWNGTQLSTTAGLSTYKWYLNNIEIAGAVTNTHIPTTSGIYKVEVTNANTCLNISDDYNLVITSLNDVILEGIKIQLFPNPVNDQLFLRVTEAGLKKTGLTIINAEGKTVYTGEIQNGMLQINTSKFATGSYTLRLTGTTETRAIKIQIVH